VHALGAILYEMLTGQRAFDGDSTHQLLYRIAFHAAPAPSEVAVVSPSMDSLVLSCLAKHPAERPSAREVAAALDIGRGSG
jgi:eukaryotic-like serine/threonine-protein kinase